jgi:hypothetical protein
LRIDHGLALDFYHDAVERYTHLIDLNAIGPDFERDRLHSLGFALAEIDLPYVVPHLYGDRIVTHVDDGFPVAHLHLVLVISLIDEDLAIARLNRDLLVPVFDNLGAMVLDLDRLIVTDLQIIVVLDNTVKIFLRVEVDVFRTGLVLNPKLVELCRSALSAAGVHTARFNAALRFVGGQFVWRHVLRVVHAPDDHRLIRVSVQKLNNHFMPDARDKNRAPSGTAPALSDTHPR